MATTRASRDSTHAMLSSMLSGHVTSESARAKDGLQSDSILQKTRSIISKYMVLYGDENSQEVTSSNKIESAAPSFAHFVGDVDITSEEEVVHWFKDAPPPGGASPETSETESAQGSG